MKLSYFLLCLVVLMGLNDTLGAQSKEELVSVHGQATDLLGHPLERVSLKFYARSWYLSSPDARLIITSITDHQGKYEARDLPYGYYAIVAAAQGFQTTEVSRVFLSKGDNLVDIGLPVGINQDIPAIEFEGIVRGPDKEPVGQATVTVMSAFNPQNRIPNEDRQEWEIQGYCEHAQPIPDLCDERRLCAKYSKQFR